MPGVPDAADPVAKLPLRRTFTLSWLSTTDEALLISFLLQGRSLEHGLDEHREEDHPVVGPLECYGSDLHARA